MLLSLRFSSQKGRQDLINLTIYREVTSEKFRSNGLRKLEACQLLAGSNLWMQHIVEQDSLLPTQHRREKRSFLQLKNIRRESKMETRVGFQKEEEIARLGLEPRLTVPKTGVLPLHYQAMFF